ncbi:ras guanine nucleotide exchange factor R-like [Metopolophium dirhodum]|uniref:ras guanine nucleotide exchange factor R-like n=1 Tax=Metopolophium dirhodum TaxID=44670 RepID=UPI00298FDE4A|nr:ras guanine nucleotide exchange factor R-like [Metopolophium dirhodum]XP_060881193.1 ras guanine nucleotide exchange factor R-like [Metopolophium dirhodum]
MYSHHRSKDSQRSSKFTAHAAVQLQRRHNNSTSSCYDGGQQLEDLGPKESVQLERLVHETFPRCNVDLIHVVNAPQMYGMYLLRKEEMQYGDRELILYHVTTKSRALESLKNGLDWRRTRRSKFGCGVSFSDDADYANYYADHFPKEENRVIIVCAVLVNKTQRVSGNQNLIVPAGGADTTLSSNGRVYVKYNDYDFYPLYLMYYRRTPEHLNESKYFRNNPRNKWQQNNRVLQQQQQQQQELKAQREREQAQRLQQEQEQAQRQQALRMQRQREQEWLEARRREAAQQELRRQELELQARRHEQAYSRQAQARQRESKSNCLIL